jgi:hypothetical protein
MLPDIDEDCERCGRRQHTFWYDPIGDLLSYLWEPRPWVNKVVAIAHNAKASDSQFIFNRAIQMKWKPELILKEIKIVSMKITHVVHRQCFIFTYATTQVTRGIWSFGN